MTDLKPVKYIELKMDLVPNKNQVLIKKITAYRTMYFTYRIMVNASSDVAQLLYPAVDILDCHHLR